MSLLLLCYYIINDKLLINQHFKVYLTILYNNNSINIHYSRFENISESLAKLLKLLG